MTNAAQASVASERSIIVRTSGQTHGPITRLASPGDLGALIRPFVFLDYIQIRNGRGPGFGWHPHSGIATLTFMFEGDMRYEDSTGQSGVLPAGGVEWMNAGGGVWHTGGPVTPGQPVNAEGFQLWVALPPDLELAAPHSQYVDPADVPRSGPASVLTGACDGVSSPVAAPGGMTYLAVTLRKGERWRFTPQARHDVAWMAVADGVAHASQPVAKGEMVIFEPGEAPIDFEAISDTRFILGSAVRHPHDLALGYYSVHTSLDALARGEAGIAELGARLRADGVIGG